MEQPTPQAGPGSAAQRARWAKSKGQKVVSIAARYRTLDVAGCPQTHCGGAESALGQVEARTQGGLISCTMIPRIFWGPPGDSAPPLIHVMEVWKTSGTSDARSAAVFTQSRKWSFGLQQLSCTRVHSGWQAHPASTALAGSRRIDRPS